MKNLIVAFVILVLTTSSFGEVGDVWTLAGDFQNSSNPGPWIDPGSAGGGSGKWEYIGDNATYDQVVVSNPSIECENSLPTSGSGWRHSNKSGWLCMNKYTSNNGSGTNYKIDDIGGHSSQGVRWTTDHAGAFEIVVGGYHARDPGIGRTDSLYLKDQTDDEIDSIEVNDTHDGSANAVYLPTYSVYLGANEYITAGLSGGDWVGLIVTITEITPDSNLTIVSNPAEVITILPYANDTGPCMAGSPVDIKAYPMVTCSSDIKYVFDYWEVNNNAVIADSTDPITTVTVSQSGNAQITAHYSATQPSDTDCMSWDLWFDGVDDYVDVVGYTGISGPDSRTVSAWIRTASNQYGQILSWGSCVDGQKWMFRTEPDGTLGVGVWGGYIKTSQTVNDNRCHHVAAVLSNDGDPDVSEIQLYIDGVLETSPYASNNRQIQTSDIESMLIGSRLNTDGVSHLDYFDGFIGDVRIYNRALSSTEVDQLASGTEVATGLDAHWPLDELSFNIAHDTLGNNDGTINGDFIRAFEMLCAQIAPTPLAGDVNRDNIVDLSDLVRLAEDWLRTDCAPPYYCMGADIDQDDSVNLEDYSSLSKNWQAYIGDLHNMGYVVITHGGGPGGDGGDFGSATPGTATQGIQEAIDYGVANEKDVYILGTMIYFASQPIYFPPAKNWRFMGPGYGINFTYGTGDFVVFDSLINCEIELGLLIAQGPGIENGNSLAMLRPQNPVDGEIVVRNSKILINAPVGGGNVFGGGYDGKGTGLTLDPIYGPIEHNTFLMLEVNACNTGLELLGGSYPIRNNSFVCPFNHITNNPVVVYSGMKNKFNMLIDTGGVVTPGIGCNIAAAEHNVFRIFPPGGGGALGSNAIVFGPDSRNNIVYADGVGIGSTTNNSNYDTDKLILPSTPGFSITTPSMPATGVYRRNETLCTVAVIIANAGNVSSWRIKDSLGNFHQIDSGLRQGQQIYLEPGDEILFNYTSVPGWRWRALER